MGVGRRVKAQGQYGQTFAKSLSKELTNLEKKLTALGDARANIKLELKKLTVQKM